MSGHAQHPWRTRGRLARRLARILRPKGVLGIEACLKIHVTPHGHLGFSVDAIRSLLALSDDPDRPCEQANALAAEQLADVEAKISLLEALRDELQRMVLAGCHGRAGDCRVIEALGDRTLCDHGHDRPPGRPHA